MNDFQDYKEIHYFMNPDDPLKGWISEKNYINFFKRDWDALIPVVQECFAKIEFEDDQATKLNSAILTLNIEIIYSQAVEMIKRYNKNN